MIYISPEDDWQILECLERAQEAIEGASIILARRYEVRLTTPYFGENVSDIRHGIEKSYK